MGREAATLSAAVPGVLDLQPEAPVRGSGVCSPPVPLGDTAARRHVGVPFARALAVHGDRLAVVTPSGDRITYRELAERMTDMVRRLGSGRRLLLISARNELEPLIAYLAGLAAGHPVLLTSPDGGHLESMIDAYDPDVVYSGAPGAWRLSERRRGSSHEAHPELALLLSTSGSTGSPKLVRLSAENVQSNAESIAAYLNIADTDRAITSLPMHYCYGLSVINSNLARGAAIVLSDHSVVDEEFWTVFRDNGCTSLHGVPYTFELLDRIGFADLDLPTLRYITQAGGKLAAERVERLARVGERNGWKMVVMYGQTEATARMAYLPPELAVRRPGSIGVPIPGGSFRLEGGADEGELVYSGPNVMLGYASGPADLALGRTVRELHTGDIARRGPDGLYEVIGRKSRFIKPFGLRVDLDRLERLLGERGLVAACAGGDDGLVVGVTKGMPEEIRAEVADLVGLPGHFVRVRLLDELPRLSTGKVDYAALAADDADVPAQPSTAIRRKRAESPRAIYQRVLRLPRVGDDDTFVGLGGDSLSYVRVSLDLERALGRLPDDWPTTAVGELERMRPTRGIFAAMETNIVLRAVAIFLVVATHIGLFNLMGGAHLLLVISGWCFARFMLADGARSAVSTRILRSAARVAVPAMIWIAYRAAATDDVVLSNILLVNNYLRTGAPGFWYIEVLIQTLVLLGVLFSVPAVRRFEASHGFATALMVLGAGSVARLFIDDTVTFPERGFSTHGVLWFFALGWLAHRAETVRQKLVVLALAAVLLPGFFGQPVREVVVGAGFVLLLLVPRLPVPRPLVRVLGLIAGASLYIYLTHYALYPELLAYLSPVVVTALSLVLGIVAWWLVERATTLFVRGSAAARGRAGALLRNPRRHVTT